MGRVARQNRFDHTPQLVIHEQPGHRVLRDAGKYHLVRSKLEGVFLGALRLAGLYERRGDLDLTKRFLNRAFNLYRELYAFTYPQPLEVMFLLHRIGDESERAELRTLLPEIAAVAQTKLLPETQLDVAWLSD